MRYLDALTIRMILSHVVVAVLSMFALAIGAVFLFGLINTGGQADDDAMLAYHHYIVDRAVEAWLIRDVHTVDYFREFEANTGFVLVAADGRVHFVQSFNTMGPCAVGDVLAECAPQLAAQPDGERFIDIDGERFSEISQTLIGGQQVKSWRLAQMPPSLLLVANDLPLTTWWGWFIIASGLTLLVAVALAAVLVGLVVRPQAERLVRILDTSRRFAEGDLTVRTGDCENDDVGELACQFDDMAATLAQNISALEDLAQHNADLREQAERVAIQSERLRLSRDLHDSVAQRLFSLSANAAPLPDLIRRDPVRGREQAVLISALAEETLNDLRSVLVDMRPSAVIQRGLVQALEALCAEWQQIQGIGVECVLDLMDETLPPENEDMLYRVIQEALSNIAKHAQARTVQIALVQLNDLVCLRIADDGVGFNAHAIQAEGHFGLLSMRERTQMGGGDLIIESDAGKGTVVQLILNTHRNALAVAQG